MVLHSSYTAALLPYAPDAAKYATSLSAPIAELDRASDYESRCSVHHGAVDCILTRRSRRLRGRSTSLVGSAVSRESAVRCSTRLWSRLWSSHLNRTPRLLVGPPDAKQPRSNTSWSADQNRAKGLSYTCGGGETDVQLTCYPKP